MSSFPPNRRDEKDMNKPHHILCDCNSRVLWIGEDENGRLAVVSSLLVILDDSNSPPRTESYSGEPTAFVSGQLVTLLKTDKRVKVVNPFGPTIFGDIETGGILDSKYLGDRGELLVLTNRELVKISLFQGLIQVSVPDLGDGNQPKFECLAATDDCAVLYRYGLGVYASGQFIEIEQCKETSYVALLPNKQIAATSDNGEFLWHLGFDALVKKKSPLPTGSSEFLGLVNDSLVFVWSDNGTLYGKLPFRSEIQSIGEFEPEPFLGIHELDILAIGTIEGVLILWDLKKSKCRYAKIPGERRIVCLYWWKAAQQLVIGTRDGLAIAYDVKQE
jgi:hypothetical protein